MCFYFFANRKKMKRSPKLKKNKDGNHGERVPVPSVLPRARVPGVFPTSGRRGRCRAGAATPRVLRGLQGGGPPAPKPAGPALGKPLPPGLGRRSGAGPGTPRRRAHNAASRAVHRSPKAEGLGPSARTPPPRLRPGLLRGPRRGKGRGGRAGRCPRPAPSATSSRPPGTPNLERSSRMPLAQRVLGRERRILVAERNNQIFIRFPARCFTIEYTSYLVGNLPESHK